MCRIPNCLQYFEVTSLDNGASVHIKLPTETLNYQVYSPKEDTKVFLYNTNGNNHEIFERLGIRDHHSFVASIVGYGVGGAFPEVENKEDLLKVIVALDKECIKKFRGKYDTDSDFKVGDKVVILPRVRKESSYAPYYTDGMTEYAGKIARIIEVDSTSCNLDVDNGRYFWPKETLKLLTDIVYETTSESEPKPTSELNMIPKKKHYQLDFNIH